MRWNYLSREIYLNRSLSCQYLFFTFIVWMMKIKGINENMEGSSMPFLVFRRDHLRSKSGIICGSGSFAVQFVDHFRSGDHLWSGIICGAVQIGSTEFSSTFDSNRRSFNYFSRPKLSLGSTHVSIHPSSVDVWPRPKPFNQKLT